MISALLVVVLGTLIAVGVDRYNESKNKSNRAQIILRSLEHELQENHETLKLAKPVYKTTAWGKSFYVSTIAWETAVSSGDLPDLIGYELANVIANQYGLLLRIRYYVDLLTKLWFAPQNIDGYEPILEGFTKNIIETMDQALEEEARVMKKLQGHQTQQR